MPTRQRLVLALHGGWLLASLVACTTPNPDYRRRDAGACTAETDAQFCARLGATCEDVTREDNCGLVRTAACGACSGTDVCAANVCKPPVCSGFSFPAVTLIADLNAPGKQDAITGVSTDGKTVLWQRRDSCAASFQLLIADSNGGAFVSADLSGLSALAPMAITAEGTLALTADALTIIGASADRTQFLQSTRTSIGGTDFGPTSNADFAALTVAAPTKIDFPAISTDGLAFYYRMFGNPDASQNGLYETVRTSTAVPFPAARKMPGVVQNYALITAVSSDRMTLFVQNNSYQMAALTRKSVKAAFANPNFPGVTPMPPAFRTRPLGDCQAVIGTYTTSGCSGEDIAVYARP